MLVLLHKLVEHDKKMKETTEKLSSGDQVRDQIEEASREDVVHLLHEHLAPTTLFSVAAFSQLQFSADCFPQEHLACEAQTHAPLERPQHVVGTAISN